MCDLDVTGEPSIFSVIHSAAALVRMLPTFDLNCEENTARLKWNWSLVDYVKMMTDGKSGKSVMSIFPPSFFW